MDNEPKKNLITMMDSVVEHIEEVESYIIVCKLHGNEFMITFNGDTNEMQAMLLAIISKLSDDFDVVEYSHFLLQFNMFARRLMEQKYGSESELAEEDS